MPNMRSPMARGRRSLRGGSRVLSWLKRAASNIHSFVKKNKLLSKGGKFVSSLGVVPEKYKGLLEGATKTADAMGYGRARMQRSGAGIGLIARLIMQKKRRGRGMRLAGGSLRLAGAQRY